MAKDKKKTKLSWYHRGFDSLGDMNKADEKKKPKTKKPKKGEWTPKDD